MVSGPENSIKLVLLGHPSDKLLPMNIYLAYGGQNQWLPVNIMLSIHNYSLSIAEPNITKIKKKVNCVLILNFNGQTIHCIMD